MSIPNEKKIQASMENQIKEFADHIKKKLFLIESINGLAQIRITDITIRHNSLIKARDLTILADIQLEEWDQPKHYGVRYALDIPSTNKILATM